MAKTPTTLVDQLEQRRLFAAVTWDGGAGTTEWADAQNWSTDVLPGVNDDVTVDANNVTAYRLASIQVRSLTLSNLFYLRGEVTVSNGVTVKSGGVLRVPLADTRPYATLRGGGEFVIEAGARVGDPYSRSPDALEVRLPVVNRGTYVAGSGLTFATTLTNHGTFVLLSAGGDFYGSIVNESTGTLAPSWPGNSGGVTRIGVQRSAAGVVSAAPIINRGTISTGGASLFTSISLEVITDQSPTLGGNWSAKSAGYVEFTTLGTVSTQPVVDSSFAFLGGILAADNVRMTVRNLAVGASLRLSGTSADATRVTLADADAQLNQLQLLGGTLTVGSANGVLRAADVGIDPAARFELGSATFVDLNRPYWGLRTGINPLPNPSPATSPVYADALRSTLDGQTLTVSAAHAASTDPTRGVAYTRGDALAQRYPAGTFAGGVPFDGDDLIFRASLRGDTDLDRDVDFADLLALARRYGSTTARGVADGNVTDPANASGSVDFDDLLALARNYGQTLAIPPTPSAAARAKQATQQTLVGQVVA